MKYFRNQATRLTLAFLVTILAGWWVSQTILTTRVDAQAGRQSTGDKKKKNPGATGDA